ncbi:MAG TPA: T9SS type A sorting domain-containing protein, partial [Puia sp.]|nr:T9SS type A sorting domain-containing protein [Puia sp.]
RALPNGNVGLSWKTTDESDVSHFTIQRSAEGTTWQDAGSVNAQGSSPLENSYSFTDLTPFPVKDYYRLQIVDNDGNLSYSSILVADLTKTNSSFVIFPNPATDQVTIRYSGISGTTTLQLMNIEGKILLQKKLGSSGAGSVLLPVSMYPPGNYLVQVLRDGHVIHTGKLVIQRR